MYLKYLISTAFVNKKTKTKKKIGKMSTKLKIKRSH